MPTAPTLRSDPVGTPSRRRRPKSAFPSLFPSVPEQRDTEPSALPVAPGTPGHDREVSGRPTASTIVPLPVLPSPTGSIQPRHRKPAVELVGIARLAAVSPPAPTQRGSGQRPEYFLLPVRSILNRCDSERVPFEWTINPYRGCEFACRYCYARYTHEYMELDGAEFDNKIFVKQNAGPLVSWDLDHRYSTRPADPDSLSPPHIAIGTATDPYQPAEREFGATRAILEQIARREGLSVSITTKSNQVVRDIDLLKRITARSSLFVNITVTTLRTRLARLLEPRAPRPDLRLAAVKALREAGIPAGVFASPILPVLTDGEADLDALAHAASDAGAQWFIGGALFLMPSSQKQFFPFLEEKFPKLLKQYRKWFARSGYAPEEYRAEITERVRKIRAKYHLGAKPYGPDARIYSSPQLALALNAERGPIAVSNEPMRSCAAG